MSDICYTIRKMKKIVFLKAKARKDRPERKRGVYHGKK